MKKAVYSFALLFAFVSFEVRAEGSEFTLTETTLKQSRHADRYVRVGETLSLKVLGRRFSESQVSAVYEQGDDEYEYYKIQHGQIEIRINYDDRGVITGITTGSLGVADPSGAQVGSKMKLALGQNAYCNTHMEDEMSYCSRKKDKGLRYDFANESNCQLPESKNGTFSLLSCLKILRISTH